MPRRVEDFRGLTHLSRLRLLHAVQTEPGHTLADLAARVDLHPNTAREHLTVMEREGLVRSRTLATGSRGRPPVVFEPVENAEDTPAASRRAEQAKERGELFRTVTRNLVEDSPSDDPADTAGSAAVNDPVKHSDGDVAGDSDYRLTEGARHQLDTLYEHLDDAGFQPALNERDLTLDLVPCQYFGAMDRDSRTVCAVHVRLIEAHLAQVPGPVELRRVEPFVTPSSCSIALGLAGEPTRSAGHDDGTDSDALPAKPQPGAQSGF